MTDTRATGTIREELPAFFRHLQKFLCKELSEADGGASFSEDTWVHQTGGGGITRAIQKGRLFEKGGVNFSEMTGTITDRLAEKMNLPPQEVFATGISVVLHPQNPYIPTVHMNLRYIVPSDGRGWFGGGIDLTPWYIFEDDISRFHRTLKAVCDRYNTGWYQRFKKQCDEYFYLPHRNEARGVGGIFFDYERNEPEMFAKFLRDVGDSFLPAYLPIAERHRDRPWSERHRNWQTIRRGRYAEFNLVYDRGTLFGLETAGRTESVLISLPPEVRWEYDNTPESGSEEEKLVEYLRRPRTWA